jgi:hypothetical protein
MMIMAPIAAALVLIIHYGTETRGLDLRALERPGPDRVKGGKVVAGGD